MRDQLHSPNDASINHAVAEFVFLSLPSHTLQLIVFELSSDILELRMQEYPASSIQAENARFLVTEKTMKYGR